MVDPYAHSLSRSDACPFFGLPLIDAGRQKLGHAPAAVAAAAADPSVAAEAPGARGAGRDRARRGDAGGEIDRCGAAGTDATLAADADAGRSEEPTFELQSLIRNSFALFCFTKKKNLIQVENQPLHRH